MRAWQTPITLARTIVPDAVYSRGCVNEYLPTDNNDCALPAVCQGSCVVPPGHLAACASTQFPCAYLDDYCGEAPGANSATCLPRLAPGTPCTVSDSLIDQCVMDAHCAPNAAGEEVCIPLAWLPTLSPGPDCGG